MKKWNEQQIAEASASDPERDAVPEPTLLS
jgi:hypothetical protein